MCIEEGDHGVLRREIPPSAANKIVLAAHLLWREADDGLRPAKHPRLACFRRRLGFLVVAHVNSQAVSGSSWSLSQAWLTFEVPPDFSNITWHERMTQSPVTLLPHSRAKSAHGVAPEHSGSRIAKCRVEHTARDLRRRAEHCRQLAEGTVGDRTRTILLVMATEYDEQADLEGLPGPAEP